MPEPPDLQYDQTDWAFVAAILNRMNDDDLFHLTEILMRLLLKRAEKARKGKAP